MLNESPLRHRHLEPRSPRRPDPATAASRPGAATGHEAEPPPVELLPYGPGDTSAPPACEVVATFGDLEAEYASIRRGAGLLDCPHRGTLVIRGADRVDFLDRLLTQKLADLAAGDARAAFQLGRNGRIQSELLCVGLDDRIVVDVDVHAAAATAAALEEMVFTEDVAVEDATGRLYHLSVHGPRAPALVETPAPGHAAAATIGDAEVIVIRRDQTGEIGLELIVERDAVVAVWDALRAKGERSRPVRPIGWHAFNVARIEAGTPLFLVDFGPESLPHETGLLHERVCFTKGCYPGQEIVARTENLGRPKQSIAGLRVEVDRLPAAGDAVFERPADPSATRGGPVGRVTSSTLSPMLGATPIALAMLKADWTAVGTRLAVDAEGDAADATVVALPFWAGGSAGDPG